ncbi:MAG: SAM-dependent methyltransferase [Nitrosomonadales bacterium]|nr:SAM-dependent methyltransferase [Nitrosomonadales bacterium]
MRKLLTYLGARYFPNLAVMERNFSTLACDLGQWRSVKAKMAVDANGAELPWYTYPAIEYLTSFDFRDCDVFEFGSGNSSLFWSERARSVFSVEDNLEWHEAVNRKKRKNQTLIHRKDESGYVNSLAEQDRSFEIIVIDGKWRMQCAEMAIRHLKDGGMIVLDNSDRTIEKKCGEFLREQGLVQIDFSGFGPINGYCWSTSIFIKTPFLLQRNFAGPAPIGGLKN